MLQVEIALDRLIMTFVVQLTGAIINMALGIRILKGQKSLAKKMLCTYFILLGTPFLVAIPFIFIEYNPLSTIVYFIMLFLLFYSLVFLIAFVIILSHPTKSYSSRSIFLILSIYILIIILLLSYPNGVTVNESTGWRPHFSWDFLIVAYVYTSIGIVLPTAYTLGKTYKLYSSGSERKRLVRILITCLIAEMNLYGAALYNTWDNVIYRTIWGVISFLIFTGTGFFFYYNMKK